MVLTQLKTVLLLWTGPFEHFFFPGCYVLQYQLRYIYLHDFSPIKQKNIVIFKHPYPQNTHLTFGFVWNTHFYLAGWLIHWEYLVLACSWPWFAQVGNVRIYITDSFIRWDCSFSSHLCLHCSSSSSAFRVNVERSIFLPGGLLPLFPYSTGWASRWHLLLLQD